MLGQPKVKDLRTCLTFCIGSSIEPIVAQDLRYKGHTVECDVEVKEKLSDQVTLTAHVDFIVDDLTFEHKSISSIKSYTKYIKKGEYSVLNLTQLVNYMVMREKAEGVLLYTNVTYGNSGEKAGDQRAYRMSIDDNGIVYVDGIKEERFSVLDILRFREEAVEVLENQTIYPYPPAPYDIFSPCKGCWLEQVCSDYECHGSKEKYFADATILLDLHGRR
jgi:hypothetical protein